MQEDKITERIKKQYEEGIVYIYPQNKSAWLECVKERNCQVFEGKDIEYSLMFMRKLTQRQSIREVYDFLVKYGQMSNDCFAKVVEIVTNFSKHGIEFYAWVMGNIYACVISGNDEKRLSKIARKNQLFEKQLKDEDFLLKEMN